MLQYALRHWRRVTGKPTVTPARPDKVFCIGLGRTGTTTFGNCMQRLGYRHLGWVGGDGGLRRDLGLLAMIDEQAFITYLDAFDSADDYPIPLWYARLAERYPSARFVLTTRASAGQWADSIIGEFNRKQSNEGDNLWYEGDLYAPDRRSRLLSRYDAHLAAVRAFFAGSPRLLEVCWERGDGWPELCGFLGLAVPMVPFPHTNKSRSTPPLEVVRTLIDGHRHGKLALYLQDQRDEALVSEARRILAPRIERKLATPGNPSVREAMQVPSGHGRGLRASQPVELAVCAIFRDEARYLQEWLTFHRGVGAERFFLYNDRSTDDYQSVLAPWIERGIVTVHDWPEQTLTAAYNDCLHRHRNEAVWIAFLDIDEYLYSPSGRPVPEILRGYGDAAAVFVYWSLFGSGGHVSAPDASVVESYRRCQSIASAVCDDFDHGTPSTSDYVTAWSRDGKSVVRTAWIEVMGNHQPQRVRQGRVIDENGAEMPPSARERRLCRQPFSQAQLRINHYWSKSLEELTRRSQRGSVFNRSRPPKRLDRLLERESQLNECLDEVIQPIWERIRLGPASPKAGRVTARDVRTSPLE